MRCSPANLSTFDWAGCELEGTPVAMCLLTHTSSIFLSQFAFQPLYEIWRAASHGAMMGDANSLAQVLFGADPLHYHVTTTPENNIYV